MLTRQQRDDLMNEAMTSFIDNLAEIAEKGAKLDGDIVRLARWEELSDQLRGNLTDSFLMILPTVITALELEGRRL